VPYNCLAFSDDLRFIATGQASGEFTIRRRVDGLLLASHTFMDAIHSVAFSPEVTGRFKLVAAGDRSGLVHLLPVARDDGSTAVPPLESQRYGWQWQAHRGRVYSMVFSSTGSHLFTAGEDGLLHAWNLDLAAPVRVLRNGTSDFAVVNDSQSVAIYNGRLVVIDMTTGSETYQLAIDEPPWRQVCWAPRVGRVFALALDGRIFSWPLTHGGIRRQEWQPGEGEIADSFSVSADGRRLAVRFYDGLHDAYSLELYPGEPPRRLPCRSVTKIAHSPDGNLLAYSLANDVHVVGSESGQTHHVLQGHSASILQIAFSPDGRFLATAASDRSIRIWDCQTGDEVWSETAHANAVHCLAFTPDGRTIATSGGDGMLRLWRWEDATMTFELPLVQWPVDKIEFSPDAMQIVVRETGSDQIRVYDAAEHGGNTAGISRLTR
jgi:WD40 repeat protein